MLWRFFKRLQQTIESSLRKHVDFVNDINLCTRHYGSVARVIYNLTHIVDAGMRCCVHFQNINMSRLDDRLTMRTNLWHMDCWLINGRLRVTAWQLVVKGARKNARRCCLSDATNTR